ncbi:hypothetical protein ABPG72_020806 [Tetrahymena utriculariae]
MNKYYSLRDKNVAMSNKQNVIIQIMKIKKQRIVRQISNFNQKNVKVNVVKLQNVIIFVNKYVTLIIFLAIKFVKKQLQGNYVVVTNTSANVEIILRIYARKWQMLNSILVDTQLKLNVLKRNKRICNANKYQSLLNKNVDTNSKQNVINQIIKIKKQILLRLIDFNQKNVKVNVEKFYFVNTCVSKYATLNFLAIKQFVRKQFKINYLVLANIMVNAKISLVININVRKKNKILLQLFNQKNK